MPRDLIRRILNQESIAYQTDRKLFTELAATFTSLMEANDYSPAALKTAATEIHTSVTHHTGMNVQITWMPHTANALAELPVALNTSNPLIEAFKPLLRIFPGEHQKDIEKLKKLDQTLTGLVDVKKGVVGGVFSKLPLRVLIGLPLFSKTGFLRFTAEEMAAVLLHELGHLFSFFELLAVTVMTNYALTTVVEALRNEPNRAVRIQLIEATAEGLNANVSDTAKLADEKNPEVVQAVILNALVKESRSDNGSRAYDFRSFEFLADQFATLHGAGRALATSLDKLMAWGSGSFRLQREWSTFHSVVSVARSLLLTGLQIYTGLIMLLILFLPGLDEYIYDPPRERLTRIKRNLIQALKDDRLSHEQRQTLLADVESVDELIAIQPNSTPFYMYIWRQLTSTRREQYRQATFQQDLEALAANDLFVAGHRLSTLRS